MSKTFIAFALVGSGAFAWGGGALMHRMGSRLDFVMFAIGILLLAQLPAVILRTRVRRLEAQLGLAGNSVQAS